MPVIVLAGEEELLMYERLDLLKEEYLDPAWASFNYSRILQPDLKQVIDGAATIPFGPGNKVIVFDLCDLFTKKRGGKSDDEAPAKGKAKSSEKILEDLEQALANIAPNTYLIFCCPANFDKSLKVSKIFEKHAEIQAFDKIKYWAGSNNDAMNNWCRKRAHKFQAVIDDEAIDYLAESNDANLRMIAMEIEKAAVYILPEKRISLEVISNLSPHFSNVFALLDHWVKKENDLVLSGIQEVLSKQQSAIPVFAVIQTTLSKWVAIKAASERVLASLPAGRGIQRRELPVAEMTKRLQSEIKVHPFVLKMDLERVQKVSLEFLVEKKKELTRLENSVKTGQIPDVHALTIFFTA